MIWLFSFVICRISAFDCFAIVSKSVHIKSPLRCMVVEMVAFLQTALSYLLMCNIPQFSTIFNSQAINQLDIPPKVQHYSCIKQSLGRVSISSTSSATMSMTDLTSHIGQTLSAPDPNRDPYWFWSVRSQRNTQGQTAYAFRAKRAEKHPTEPKSSTIHSS